MNYALLHSIATVAAMIAFGGICWWAYTPGNRDRFEKDGHLPLETDPLSAHIIKTEKAAGEKSE
jgi:cytochrome c oxidase cbb3-type subunit IV